jgi:hypothetical protein
MNLPLLLLIGLAFIWLLGAVLAILEMWIVNITILTKYDSEYTSKEFIEGFLKSWFTLYFVTEVIINELDQ